MEDWSGQNVTFLMGQVVTCNNLPHLLKNHNNEYKLSIVLNNIFERIVRNSKRKTKRRNHEGMYGKSC